MMRAGMEAGSGDDLAVVHFSGHGALVDGKLFCCRTGSMCATTWAFRRVGWRLTN